MKDFNGQVIFEQFSNSFENYLTVKIIHALLIILKVNNQ